MNVLNLCGPVVLYLGFSLVQIIIDIFRKHFNIALLKFLVMIIFSVVLNVLCSKNLGIVAWMIVFIPFIFMTVITTLLLISFGLNPTIGKNKHIKSDNIGKNFGDEIAEKLYNKYSNDIGGDPSTWSPPNDNIGGDPATWSPPNDNIGGDPATWSPPKDNIGGDPATWSPPKDNIGGDPATWSPPKDNIGGDPATWSPPNDNIGGDSSTSNLPNKKGELVKYNLYN